ncbi:MAG: CbiX/SirB N-terminal domain-containing protein [Nitrospirales bacterium]|nr:CbiX/SirB N-terminal domain-containing protein [Nitrospirales bacterium]
MKRDSLRGVLLVGHGGIPKDYPREFVTKVKTLEARRRASGTEPTAEEIDLDQRIRQWPRTPETDPYRAGFEALASHLKGLLEGVHFAIAYNEFCAPTVEEALEEMIQAGITTITVVPSMLTPGGSHSEIEIPESLERLRVRFPRADIRYAWPFDLPAVATMLATQLQRFGS